MLALRSTGQTLESEVSGALFEGLTAQVLRAYRDWTSAFDDMYYWASAENSSMEVDFILRRGDELIAVEVKSGQRFNSKWCRSLRAVKTMKGLRKRILVMPETEHMETSDGIEVISFLELNERLSADKLWQVKPADFSCYLISADTFHKNIPAVMTVS